MRVMWICNIPTPEASILMNKPITPFGGWLDYASTKLSEHEDIELFIIYPLKEINNITSYDGKVIKYYAFPEKYIKHPQKGLVNPYIEEIINLINPEVIHIYGTEQKQTLATINCVSCNKVVISIQGLVSFCAKHYFANLPFNVIYGKGIRELLKMDSLKKQRDKFIKNGQSELLSLKKAMNVIGRTSWDYACVKQINPDINYYICNEILRREFYHHEWNINSCERFSIFVSQGSYPLKGLHYMLEALNIIVQKYPQTKLYIGGKNIIEGGTIFNAVKRSRYGNYLRKYIKDHKLEKNVIFTGLLSEEQMCNRYIKSHIFISPSSIENSPNSLGEAMLLGVPCIASNVGGVSDLISHKEEGFVYQSDASYMLAHYIGMIFSDDNLANKFSEKAKLRAQMTHNPETNTKQLIHIYNRIVKGD